MSKDLKIFKICDHLIFKDQVQIDSDLKTIRLPRTLSSKKVKLFINGFEISSTNFENGWTLQEDELATLTNKSKIVFNSKRRSMSDFYQVDYSVLPNFCPKCWGKRFHNDESYSALGKSVFVSNEEKLVQEVRKGILTVLGSNPFHTWIGTQIDRLVGSKIFDAEIIRSRVVQEINNYLEKYIDIQTQQAAIQIVTDREAFLKTLLIDVTQEIEIDPSIWTITVIFQNRTGSELIVEKKVQVPGIENDIRKLSDVSSNRYSL